MQSVQRGWENWAPTTENQVDPDLTLNNQSYTRSVSLALVCDFRFNPFASHGATEQCPCLCDPAWVSGAVSTFTWSVCFVYTLVHSAYLDIAVVFGVISLFSLFSKPLSLPLSRLPSLLLCLHLWWWLSATPIIQNCLCILYCTFSEFIFILVSRNATF